MSKKKLFSIPTIGDMKTFERKKSEVKSHFNIRNKSPDIAPKNDGLQSASTSTLNGPKKQLSAPVSTAISRSATTLSDMHTSIKPTIVVSATSAADEPYADEASSSRTSIVMPHIGGSGGVSLLKRKFPVTGSELRSGEDDMQLPILMPALHLESTSAGPSKAATPNSIVVNPRQRGNPILKHVRNVPWQFGDIVPDYVMGRTVCALFLSLRYHHLNPNYIHERLKELGRNFELRILLVQVDVKDPHHSLKELARMAILADCTLLLAWSVEEAGRYLETYKAYENKPADALKERIDQDYLSKMQDCLTTVKSVKKNDVVTLLTTFGTLDKIIAASKEDLSLVPGFGSLKAQRLYSIFHEPFIKTTKAKPQDELPKQDDKT